MSGFFFSPFQLESFVPAVRIRSSDLCSFFFFWTCSGYFLFDWCCAFCNVLDLLVFSSSIVRLMICICSFLRSCCSCVNFAFWSDLLHCSDVFFLFENVRFARIYWIYSFLFQICWLIEFLDVRNDCFSFFFFKWSFDSVRQLCRIRITHSYVIETLIC